MNMNKGRISGLIAGAAVLALVAATISGCGNSTSPIPPPGGDASRVFASTAVNGHTHNVTITKIQVTTPQASGVETATTMSLDHFHLFDMTQAQLMTVNGGTPVTVTTGASDVTGTHTHDITVAKWF